MDNHTCWIYCAWSSWWFVLSMPLRLPHLQLDPNLCQDISSFITVTGAAFKVTLLGSAWRLRQLRRRWSRAKLPFILCVDWGSSDAEAILRCKSAVAVLISSRHARTWQTAEFQDRISGFLSCPVVDDDDFESKWRSESWWQRSSAALVLWIGVSLSVVFARCWDIRSSSSWTGRSVAAFAFSNICSWSLCRWFWIVLVSNWTPPQAWHPWLSHWQTERILVKTTQYSPKNRNICNLLAKFRVEKRYLDSSQARSKYCWKSRNHQIH